MALILAGGARAAMVYALPPVFAFGVAVRAYYSKTPSSKKRPPRSGGGRGRAW